MSYKAIISTAGALAALTTAFAVGALATAAHADAGPRPLTPQQVPHMRAGEWSIMVLTDGRDPQAHSLCTSGRAVTPPPVGPCSISVAGLRPDGGIVSASVCRDAQGHTWDVKALTTGYYDRAFLQVAIVTVTGPGASGRPAQSRLAYSYQGACHP